MAAFSPLPANAESKLCRGVEINGPRLSGADLTPVEGPCPPGTKGPQLRHALLQSLQLRDGSAPRDVKLVGARLVSAAQPAADFTFATLLGEGTTGGQVRLRIEGQTEVAGVPVYSISYQWGDGKDAAKRWRPTSPFAPICPAGERALLLAGTWDYRPDGRAKQLSTSDAELTVACEGAAMGKCALRIGYRPWEVKELATGGGAGQLAMRPYWEACVRAVRADYCGNGDSLTQAGMTLNLYDRIGVQKDEKDWPLEAQWSPDGARCIGETRLSENPLKKGETVQAYLARTCKDRLRAGAKECLPAAGSVLWTEIPPRP